MQQRPARSFTVIFTSMLAVTIVLVLLSASIAFAQQGARVTLEEVTSTDGTVMVDVIAENVTNLYGAEFKLLYDPAMVSVQDVDPQKEGVQVEPGEFLPANQGFVVVNQADDAEGTVSYALTLLNPAPPATGTGPLARVTFKVLQEEPFSLEIDNVKLVSIDLQTIPTEVQALSISGAGNGAVPSEPVVVEPNTSDAPASTVPAVAAPPEQEVPEVSVAPAQPQLAAAPAAEDAPVTTAPVDEFPWWIVAAGVMLMGFICLGVFAVMGSLNNPPSTPQTTSQSQPQNESIATGKIPDQAKQQRHVPGSRPSAFK